jgi:hypothetical protein
MVAPHEGGSVASPLGRWLGEGRHPAAATEAHIAVAFVEAEATPPRVGVQLLDARGERSRLVDVGAAGAPASFANPVVAALPSGNFAVGFNDLNGDGAELGVALRLVSPEGEVRRRGYANATAVGAQYDPDLLWAAGELVVAWTDTSDPLGPPKVRARRFDAELNPLAGEVLLGESDLPEGNVALAPAGSGWAAAWREAQEDGTDAIVVFAGGVRWRVPAGPAGPASDRPAILAFDPEHLFVAFSVGTDPYQTGLANTPRLYGAVIDRTSGEVAQLGPIEPLLSPYAGTDLESLELAQSQPAAVAAGQSFFLAWRSGARSGDAAGEELWL